MTRTFKCVQGSPEIPKGSEVRQNGEKYELYIDGKRYINHKGNPVYMYPWQIEGNECWEEVTPELSAIEMQHGDTYHYLSPLGAICTSIWYDSSFDRCAKRIGNVYRTEQEAQDEVKRRESIANAWWPKDGEVTYIWDFKLREVREGRLYSALFASEVYIGAVHPTREACEAWGRDYAHLFAKKPTDANQ